MGDRSSAEDTQGETSNSGMNLLRSTVGPKEILVNDGFCSESKAGLAAVINFKQAASILRATEKDSKGIAIRTAQELNNYQGPRLVHIKGQRRMQYRLVEPKINSLNNNDSYVLIKKNQLVVWNGSKSSIMKKAKAAEFAQKVHSKREYGCSCFRVQTLNNFGSNVSASFKSQLGDDSDISIRTDTFDEVQFENRVIATNLVYEIKSDAAGTSKFHYELDSNLSRKPLRQRMLDSSKSFILDFGSEVYMWVGSKFSQQHNQDNVDIALQFYHDQPNTQVLEGSREMQDLTKQGHFFAGTSSPRPYWTTLERVNEKCENILFTKKFADWSDVWPSEKTANTEKSVAKRNKIELDLCYQKEYADEYMINGMVINRGHGGRDPETGFYYSVTTIYVKKFRLVRTSFEQDFSENQAYFYAKDAYLIEWKFIYRRVDVKTLDKRKSFYDDTGRDAVVYFYWQGRDCTVNEKGLSAILTVFHVGRKATQIRVFQDSEIPAFINMFQGNYVSNRGKTDTFDFNASHLYLVRGPQGEYSLIEVELTKLALRSQANFLLICPQMRRIYHWQGTKATALQDFNNLIDNLTKLFSKHVFEVEMVMEDHEPEQFCEILSFNQHGSNNRNKSSPIVKFCCHFKQFDQLTINCHRILAPIFKIKNEKDQSILYDHFPILQSQLYDIYQPGLVLVCTQSEVYLWQGWKDRRDNSEDVKLEEVDILRNKNFLDTKKYVLEDCLPFLKSHNFSNSIRVIHAGFEPESFRDLFPLWTVNEHVVEIQKKLGRQPDQLVLVNQSNLSSRPTYSVQVLRARPLPENVLASELEMYLEDKDFEKVFKQTRNSFQLLPQWKQKALKRELGLF